MVRRMPTNDITELQFHASGFIVRVHGVWTENALNQFREFLKLRRLEPTDHELIRFWAQAKRIISAELAAYRFVRRNPAGRRSSSIFRPRRWNRRLAKSVCPS